MKPIFDPRFSEASYPPHISLLLLQVADERGESAERLCLGLGFTPTDLKKPGFRLSHRQGYLLVRRSLAQLSDHGLGLAVGGRQTSVSLGLVGFGMQASPTLGAALELGLRYQRHAGAMLEFHLEVDKHRARIVAAPQFYEPDVSVFYVEEAFSSAVAILRHLSGTPLKPTRLELEYPTPVHASRYEAFFECPVVFGAHQNTIEFDRDWLDIRLPTRDDAVAAEVSELLDDARWANQRHSDLLESLHREVRKHLRAPPSLSQLASQVTLSERTLRRRIESAGLTYQGIVDGSRWAKALSLLSRPDLSLADVAAQIGFSDTRNFRRAFKRWTGMAPREARKKLLQDQ
ncbi:putative HTH-type transcriptional regulator [compost metagenome]